MADTGSPFNIPYVEPTDLVRDYPAASQDLADRIAGQFAAGFQFAGTRLYTSSGTFAKADPLGTGDIGLRAIRVTVVGAGGGGGGAQVTTAGRSSAGGGGGGGAYAERFVLASALSTSEDVTRGGGGSGGVGNAVGSAGGESSFGTFAVAGGGSGGAAGPFVTVGFVYSDSGAGGVPTEGDVQLAGGQGANGFVVTAALTNRALSGAGGQSARTYGLGGQGRTNSTSTDGRGGSGVGGGGGGACNPENSAARNGGVGANGIVIIDCFV